MSAVAEDISVFALLSMKSFRSRSRSHSQGTNWVVISNTSTNNFPPVDVSQTLLASLQTRICLYKFSQLVHLTNTGHHTRSANSRDKCSASFCKTRMFLFTTTLNHDRAEREAALKSSLQVTTFRPRARQEVGQLSESLKVHRPSHWECPRISMPSFQKHVQFVLLFRVVPQIHDMVT